MVKQDSELLKIFDKYPAYSPFTRLSTPNIWAPIPEGDLPSTEQWLAAGWGYLIIPPSSMQAYNSAGLTKGIIELVNKGQQGNPDDWGAARVLDYLETDALVDA